MKNNLNKRTKNLIKVLILFPVIIKYLLLNVIIFLAVQKEANALKLMIDTYTKNPSFGDASKFSGELSTTTQKLQAVESEILQLQQELKSVMNTLDDTTSRSPSLHRSNLTQSQLSISSNFSANSLNQYSDEKDMTRRISTASNNNDSITAPPPPPPPPIVIQSNDDNTEEVEAVALYDFDDETGESLSMSEGDKFVVMEQFEDGWARVRRIEDSEEGFVPISYIEIQTK